jgi:hypothetical protein
MSDDTDIIDTLAAIHRPQWWWDKSAPPGVASSARAFAQSALTRYLEGVGRAADVDIMAALTEMSMTGQLTVTDVAPRWKRMTGRVILGGKHYTLMRYVREDGETRGDWIEWSTQPVTPYWSSRSVVGMRFDGPWSRT